MTKYTIAEANPDEAAALTSISFAAKRHWGYPEEWIESWTAVLTITPQYIQKHNLLTLRIKEEIIGFAAIEKYEDYYEVGHLWLLPAYMGKGLGKWLLKESIDRFVPPAAIIRVEADPNAVGFYTRQGFRKIGQVESYPKGRYLPVMERSA